MMNCIRGFLFVFLLSFCLQTSADQKIDRFALVSRHQINLSEFNSLNPLTVGNGEFAFTADFTGMQTFPEFYESGISLGTQSQWAWHSFPNPEGYTYSDVVKMYKVGSDSIPYLCQYQQAEDLRKYNASNWLRENPHRMHLGLIGLEIANNDSESILISDIQNRKQQLNLWTGELKSYFEVDGVPVLVTTYCHQHNDLVAFRIESDLIKSGKLKVKISFPYAAHGKFSSGYDFNSPEKHSTIIAEKTSKSVLFKRQLDADGYYSKIQWNNSAVLNETGAHTFLVVPSKESKSFEISCSFSREKPEKPLPSFHATAKGNSKDWKSFWESGAAVDFSECTDPRAFELERRVVLSQYLTKIQCSGSLPPQETGLTFNSWFGKFHMEMVWWHAAHFILWQRPELVENQFNFYFSIFDKARQTAASQGYSGVRWPKMTDKLGNESPSEIGPFLIWQQPHIIYLTELLSRSGKQEIEVLRKYEKLVEATADFMVSYTRWDSVQKRFVLGPALIPAQERFSPETTINPVFELAYWKWALEIAQNQKEALGYERNAKWQHVIDNLSELPVKDSLYLFTENAIDSYSNQKYLTDHPIVLAIGGFLPLTDFVDKKILAKTFDKVLEKWDWKTAWGWDFPLAAMCATVLDKPEKAIDMLMMETTKNSYLGNGHNYQDNDLPIYLPGNGSLLAAIAFMCSYRNEKGENGFTSSHQWKVKSEGF